MKYTVSVFSAVSRPIYLAFLIVSSLLFHAGTSFGAYADTIRTAREIAPGITFTQDITTGDHPLIVNCLHADLKTKTVHVRSGQALDAITLTGPSKGREQLHLLANRDGALGGINADYFPFTGDPLSLEIHNSELMSEPTEYRACLGFTDHAVQMAVLTYFGSLDMADSTALMLAGINRVPQPGEIVALSPTYAAAPRMAVASSVITLRDVNLPVSVSKPMHGTVTSVAQFAAGAALPICAPGCTLLVGAGQAAVSLAAHCKQDDSVRFRFDLVSNSPITTRGAYASRSSLIRGAFQPAWANVTEAVGGGPWLVRNGQIDVDWESERLNKVAFVERRHPRTAVGVTSDDVLLLVAVDGRSGISQGASLDELAAIMKGLGSVNAINLDGGGSTTMVVQGVVVNAPTDGRERPIADSLLVYSDVNGVDDRSGSQAYSGPPIVLHAGESLPLLIPVTMGQPVDPKRILWGTTDGLGFVNQKGDFTGTHVGAGSVLARVAGTSMAIPVSILPGDPSAMHGSMTPIADYPPYYTQIVVTVIDRFGNPIPGITVKADLAGGQLDNPLITAANGQAAGQIVWDVAPEKRVVKLTALTLKPVVIKQTSSTAKAAIPIDPDDR